MKLFVVSEGSSSDYRVLGILSSQENGDEFVARCKAAKIEINKIEKFELDELQMQVISWYAVVHDNGKIRSHGLFEEYREDYYKKEVGEAYDGVKYAIGRGRTEQEAIDNAKALLAKEVK